MAYRLRIRVGDREQREPLREGGNVVGSSAQCTVRVHHPSVSRRHAVITVDGESVTVADLGSSNGTLLDGRSVRGEVSFVVGMVLSLGAVTATVEAVDAGDLEAAVALPPPAEQTPAEPTDGGAMSTVAPVFLETFMLGQLPRLVDRVARGEDGETVAQAVGAALLAALPCRRVAVTRASGDHDCQIFTGSRANNRPGVPVTVSTAEGYVVEVEFTSAGTARRCEPLVEAGAGLIRAACREVTAARVPAPAVAAAPPDPPSLASSVQEIYARAALVAASGVTVLIMGESGTGKELLARYVHAASPRAAKPLVTLNCAALPRDLLEAELFGVERGVATGVEARPGVFEAAHGGTLFLDEIGDMAAETQARILRVLEDGVVYRVGGQSPRPADARVIAATNRDIDAMVNDGAFRRDLYHRIADWVVEMPPLRHRREDIPNLAVHFLARSAAERGTRPAGISRAAMEALAAYSWPGNVRELEKEIGRAALFLHDGDLLDTTDLRPALVEAARERPDESLKAVRERAEREHIGRVLGECGGSVPDAARRLEVSLSTLYARMRALELE